jgi:peptidoglycan/xylan/chitin deacetylase (PgdA/CDA1 family)
MNSKVIGLRVDVDFEIGLTKGVPFLLDFFSRNGISATFYIAMGPDGFRRSRERMRSRGYVKRVLAFNPLKIISRFGPVYLARQAFGRGGNVGADHPEILKRIVAEGHELGVHGFDHFWWAENIWNCKADAIGREMERGLEVFRRAAGIEPRVWASPNWRCSQASLQAVDRRDFPYGADTRGRGPFLPVMNGWRAKTVQMPITLPCLHEVKAYLRTRGHRAIIREFMVRINDQFNVWCIHDYYEGILERKLFAALAHDLASEGYTLEPIRKLYAAVDAQSVIACEVIKRALPGGRGEVSYQGEEQTK